VTVVGPQEITDAVGAAQRNYSLRERLQLSLITWAGYLAIRVLGPTLKVCISIEEGGPAQSDLGNGPVIQSFWHRCVFPAVYMWRDRGIGVMTSQSFDGEYIARVIGKFGFEPVRGSSTRGGARAFRGMRRVLEDGRTVAFTIDGPRGPAFVAKPGPVSLARATGAPLVMFYIALSDAWIFNTWDRFMIPKPFSKALMRVAKIIEVPADADEAAIELFQAELQAALERVQEFAEENVSKVGTPDFPCLGT
jgi:lysophospholipid acyltransferase (LPLAT)-like uncharacterized protein